MGKLRGLRNISSSALFVGTTVKIETQETSSEMQEPSDEIYNHIYQ